jgi:hypothetical protein
MQERRIRLGLWEYVRNRAAAEGTMKQEWEKSVLVSEGWPSGYILGRGGKRAIWRQNGPVPDVLREARRRDAGPSELVDLTGDDSDGEHAAEDEDGVDGEVGDDDDDHIADDDSVHQMEDENVEDDVQ